jgi:hypothetical protein
MVHQQSQKRPWILDRPGPTSGLKPHSFCQYFQKKSHVFCKIKFVIRNVYTYDCLQLKMRLSKAAVVPIKHDEVLGFLGWG